MSSPPTSNTSTKAAHLHSDHRRSSFPPLAALNLFRKKPSHKPARSPSPVEPYEVAPGIWNTDATAKVFGYLELEAKKEKSGGQLARLVTHNSQPPKPNHVNEGDSPGLKTEAYNADLTGGITPHKPKLSVQVSQPPGNARLKRVGERYQSKVERERMRTVSRDDQLIQRGANPRTGLVSPLVVSDSSDDHFGHDYVSFGERQAVRPQPKGRTRSGKWKQDVVGWSLVESPLLSPIAQSSADPMSRRVSCKELEDKLLVEMPGVDNPEPHNMTEQQMKRYQDSVARACKSVGIGAMIDPNTIPASPRSSTPEGPSTPPNRLQKIRRKMIGSGPSRKDNSNDTVVVAKKRVSSMPTIEKGSKEVQRVRIVTPSNTPKGLSQGSHSNKSTIVAGDAFLGQGNGRSPRQTGSGTHFPSLRSTQLQEGVCPSLTRHQRPPKALSVTDPATPTLSQYLPYLRFLHPSHFANLETSSYRRPAQLLPARLRPAEQQKRDIEDACIITTTSTLTQMADKEKRPRMQRQDGSISVQKASQRSQMESPILRENLFQGRRSMEKCSSAIKLTVDNSDQEISTSFAPAAAVQRQGSVRSECKAKAIVPGAEQGGRATMLEDLRSQLFSNGQTESSSGMMPAKQGLSQRSANIIRSAAPRDRRNGAGITPTSDHLGSGVDGRNWDHLRLEQEQTTKVHRQLSPSNPMPRHVSSRYDCGGWFAGQWVEDPQDQKDTIANSRDSSKRSQSRLTDIKLWLPTMNGSLHASAKLQYVQQRLHEMVCHVAQTLHPSSSAMMILRKPNIRASDYLQAAKDLLLASAYLLLLLNIFIALKKALVLVSLLIYLVWQPVKTVLAIVKWCLLA